MVHHLKKIGGTPVITRVEILGGKWSDTNINLYLETLEENPSLEEIEVHRDIAQKAHEIRTFYRKQGNNLTTPDVIHLATAIWANADAFHTLDGSGNKKKLLSISGEDGVDNLKIEVPRAEQAVFDPEKVKIAKPEEEQQKK